MILKKTGKFIEAHKMTDIQFARWLRKRGWKGDYQHKGNWCEFIKKTEQNFTIMALVKYRNHSPINRWIYLNNELS